MKEKLFFLSIFFWAPLFLKAQICTGSLGDPVVNVTFGAGSNPGKPLSEKITNYSYTHYFCPNDGSYSVVNMCTDCFVSTWHNLFEDHTPKDVNGYMMLVNASVNPGDFYVDTVRGLCPGSTYEFAAWILNILKTTSCGSNGIKPNLTFSVETVAGSVLGTYNTGDIDQSASAQWKQYGLFFTTPTGLNTIVLRLKNNARGGCGNDIVLDDITFRPCGPKINAAITINTGNATTLDLCEGDNRTFVMAALVSGTYRNPAYQWQVSRDSINFSDIRGATSTSYTRLPAGFGNFYYRMSVIEADNPDVSSCRIFSNVLFIRMDQNPVPRVSVNNPVCETGKLSLQASGGSQYVWTGPNGFSAAIPNPEMTASFENAGKYYVTVSSPAGCKTTDSITLWVYPKAQVNAGPDLTICEGNSVPLAASQAVSYVWSPATGLTSVSTSNPMASPKDSTNYVLLAKDVNGCTSADTVAVHVIKKPVAIAGADVKIFAGQSAILKGETRGTNVQFNWSPTSFMSNSNSLTPTVTPPDNITYTLNVVSNLGCGSSQAHVQVKILKTVSVPNAFSPNGDGINDEWNIDELQMYTDCNLLVFNRYGAEVFRSKGYNKKWNGTVNGRPLPVGTYYYTLDLKTGQPVLSGWVLIVK